MRAYTVGRGFFLCICALSIAAGSCGDDASSSRVDGQLPDEGTSIRSDMGSDLLGACPDGCNDADACTQDRCVDGACVHEYDVALCCTSDQCEINGSCFDNGQADPSNPCQSCVVVSSTNEWTIDNSVVVCDDGDPCTDTDTCIAGLCQGTAFVCDDDDLCTDDACDGAGGCAFVNNEAACDDGDLCTADDVCSQGSCLPGSTLACDDQNTCTVDTCEPQSGCINTPADGIACTDDDICSVSSICTDGACIADEMDTCDDQTVCTIDFCDTEAGGCDHTDISDRCADANPCTDEACDAVDGCVYPFNTVGCNDEDLCTAADTCTLGACIGVVIDPNDSNVCTDDRCDPKTGVSNQPNALPCDDGNACTVGDTCANSDCIAGAQPLDCDDIDVCTTDSCDPANGCEYVDISSSCDDGNACTTDSCDPTNGCQNTVIASFACRPDIVITYPPRAATIADALPGVVTVTGSVSSGAGPIAAFTLNGVTVSVDPATGAFSFDVTPQVGANTLVFEATDSLGTTVGRVQSYHWSTDYRLPDVSSPGVGAIDPGLGIYLDQESIDDKQAPPPTDLAAIFEGVLAGFDLSSFFDPNSPLTSAGGFDVYLTSLSFASTTVSLDAVDGGLLVNASLNDISGSLYFDCPCGFPCGCWWLGGDSTGGLDINSLAINADLLLTVDTNNKLVVTVQNASTSINGLNIYSNNGWTNFLLSIIEPFIIGGIVADLENELNSQLSTVLGPLLEDGLSALAFNQVFDIPRLDGTTPDVSVALESDFSYTDFQDANPGPQGGVFGLRAWATPTTREVPAGLPFDTNLGVPLRIGCGISPQNMVIPKAAPLEIVFPDDTINQILRAAWWGGLLDFTAGPSLLAGVDLTQYGVTNLNLLISGLLPPVASDCGPNQDLRLYVGDLEITASLDLFGQPLDAIIYVSFEAPISLGANPVSNDIEIVIQAVENVEIEVAVTQESMLGAQPALKTLLETELVPSLGALLGNGQALAAFPLPDIDLSSSLGQPPGTSVIRIVPYSDPTLPDERQAGNTVLYGKLD
jgi:hypothetical protein